MLETWVLTLHSTPSGAGRDIAPLEGGSPGLLPPGTLALQQDSPAGPRKPLAQGAERAGGLLWVTQREAELGLTPGSGSLPPTPALSLWLNWKPSLPMQSGRAGRGSFLLAMPAAHTCLPGTCLGHYED